MCYVAVVWKTKLGYDDSLDVVGIHGVGGFIGIVATGLFASIGATGLFFGNAGQFGIQVFLALVTLGFSAVGTYIILKIIDLTIGLRISPQDEEMGLDLSQHNERAYS
jgi:Amt family ammonium transporter